MNARTWAAMAAAIGIAVSATAVLSAHDGSAARPPAAAAAPDGAATKQVTPLVGTSDRHVEDVAEQVTAGSYVAITPYRAYDSRYDRRFVRGDAWAIDVLTDVHLAPQIPSNAVAITFNVTVTETETSFGFVTVFPGDAPFIPNTSTVNWALTGFTVANGGTVALGGPGQYQGFVGVFVDGAPGASTQFLIDVTGYYLP